MNFAHRLVVGAYALPMQWQEEWSSAHANILTGLLDSAFRSLIVLPTARQVHKGRTSPEATVAGNLAPDFGPKFKRRVTSLMEAMWATFAADTEVPSPALQELDQWFRSASVDSLLRQGVAAHVVTKNMDAVQSRLLAPISLSLRVSAPRVFTLHNDCVRIVASALSSVVRELVEDPRVAESEVAPTLIESCKWQIEAIDRTIELVAQPGIRIEESATFTDRYRTALATAFSKLPTPHWNGEPRVPIEKVYVPGQFMSSGSPTALAVALRLWPDRVPADATYTTDPFDNATTRHVVVLGDPGAGKTSYTSHLVHRLVAKGATVASVRRLPFIIALREYRKVLREKAAGLTFAEFIADRCAEEYQVRPPAGAIEYMLLSGTAMVIFDGLDEILNVSERRQTVERIEVFLRLFPNCPILVTSRTNGYDSTPLRDDVFRAYAVLPFSDREVRRYVDSWFGLDDDVPPGVRRAQKKTFFDSMSKLDRALYTNPLSLALLCNLSKAGGHMPLPKSRAEIFEKCSLMLYHLWDQRRGIGDVDFERDFLPLIAFAASRVIDDPSLAAGFTEDRLVRLCVDHLVPSKFDEVSEARRYARSLIEHCVGRAWVFSAVGTTDEEERFNFTHRTFLEYFAALHLARTNPTAVALASALEAWIARGERTLITQMAFEIKTRQLDGVAEEFCEALLDVDAEIRGDNATVVDWLCQEASVVPIGQGVLRRIVRLALALPEPERLVALSHLVTARGENRRLIDRETVAFVEGGLDAALSGNTEDLAALQAIVKRFAAQRTGDEQRPWTLLANRFPKAPEQAAPRPWWDDG